MHDLFLSYARADEVFASRLRRGLIEAGKDVWLDSEEISATVGWLEEVERAIDRAEVFVFVITPDSLASVHCAKELQRAMALAKSIVPVLRQDPNGTAVPNGLSQRPWISMREADDFDAALSSLVSVI